MKQIKVLFVCMGNICRSPTAHGVFQHRVNQSALDQEILVDSAGTHAYHVGNAPDQRAQATARTRGLDLSDQRARRVELSDFERFDYVLAMDQDNLGILQSLCPAQYKEKLSLFMKFAPERPESEVPDPYYGGQKGFEGVFDMVEDAAEGLLLDIREKHLGR